MADFQFCELPGHQERHRLVVAEAQPVAGQMHHFAGEAGIHKDLAGRIVGVEGGHARRDRPHRGLLRGVDRREDLAD